MSAITSHVLDTSRGLPAEGVPVRLERAAASGDGWEPVGRGSTDADGRVRELAPAGAPLAAGRYRLTFGTGPYFEASGQYAFYPEISVVFTVDDGAGHYHVPLLLNPFGYSTYRGS
ncbi:MAG: hydroxyisourate hydrolase [Solirubrobacteraceae bacterium]